MLCELYQPVLFHNKNSRPNETAASKYFVTCLYLSEKYHQNVCARAGDKQAARRHTSTTTREQQQKHQLYDYTHYKHMRKTSNQPAAYHKVYTHYTHTPPPSSKWAHTDISVGLSSIENKLINTQTHSLARARQNRPRQR